MISVDMPFLIIDRDNQPLADIDGKLILVGTEPEAREFLRPGDRGVVTWEWWLENAPQKQD